MFDLGEEGPIDAFVAKHLGEAADAIDVGVGKVNPFGLGLAGGDAAEADTDEFAGFLQGQEPGFHGVEWRHDGGMVSGKGVGEQVKLRREWHA